jgi:hypothetical protein
MNLNTFIQLEVSLNSFPYLGLRDLLLRYSLINKTCLQKVIQYVTVHRTGVTEGRLSSEESIDQLSSLIEEARKCLLNYPFVQVSPEARKAIQTTGGLEILDKTLPLLIDYCRFCAYLWSFWHKTINAAYEPASRMLREIIDAKHPDWRHPFATECRYWNSNKTFGKFIVLFERPDGTILVSENFQRVYLVVSHLDRTLAEIANCDYHEEWLAANKLSFTFDPRQAYDPPKYLHGPIIGTKTGCTLLNWDKNKIVFDGFTTVVEIANSFMIKKAIQAYYHAVDHGTLITKFEKSDEKSELRQIPNFTKEDILDMKRKMRLQLDFIKTQPGVPGFDAKTHDPYKDTVGDVRYIIALRRLGYNEEENPKHEMEILLNGYQRVDIITASSLYPPVEEYIEILKGFCEKFHYKPASLCVDNEMVVLALEEILVSHCNVYVSYYYPPSKEELFFEENTSHFHFAQHVGCAVCKRHLSQDGTKLNHCSKCKKVFYCCKEHQKDDWKRHKKSCV